MAQSSYLSYPSNHAHPEFVRRPVLAVVAFISVFAAVIAFCLSGAGIARAAGEGGDCGAGAVVIVGGTNDPDAKGLVGVKERYTGTGPDANPEYAGDNAYKVIYADYPTTLWPLGAAGYDDSVAQGKDATLSAIGTYQKECGTDKPVVVAGYSQGARVAGDVLSDIGNGRATEAVLLDEHGKPVLDEDGNPVMVPVSAENVSGELYSDPRQAGDKTGRGIELSLIGVIPGLTMNGPREGGFGELEGDVTSVCVEGDPICDLPDPLYDPFGAIDGFLGYFTKHGLYPWQMYRDPQTGQWTTGRDVVCDENNVCMVGARSAFAELFGGWAKDIGYQGDLGDFLEHRPTLDLPFGIELSRLQPVIRIVSGLLPPLPKLGYGAYLPDLFVAQDILEGIIKLSPEQFTKGVRALGKSIESIVMYPVNFATYWVTEIGAAITAPQVATAPELTTTTVENPAAERKGRRALARIDALSADVTVPASTTTDEVLTVDETVTATVGEDDATEGAGTTDGSGTEEPAKQPEADDDGTPPATKQSDTENSTAPEPGNGDGGDDPQNGDPQNDGAQTDGAQTDTDTEGAENGDNTGDPKSGSTTEDAGSNGGSTGSGDSGTGGSGDGGAGGAGDSD